MDRLHVQAPTAIVLLCGGQTSSIEKEPPLSLRDAFLKTSENQILLEKEVIQIEDTPAYRIFTQNYNDLLEFETDLAQIVELIILFCESEGSLAELGAFSTMDEIAARLFVIIRNDHWRADSFVKLGPLRSIENKYGRDAIYVLDDDEVGLIGNSAGAVNRTVLRDQLTAPLQARLAKVREPTTFQRGRPGHVIKLIVGLIQEYGALSLYEIEELLVHYIIDENTGRIRAFLLCAEAVGWIIKISKGQNDYYCACNLKGGTDAAVLLHVETVKERNRDRRRMLIREHWKKTDPQRDRAIVQALTGRIK